MGITSVLPKKPVNAPLSPLLSLARKQVVNHSAAATTACPTEF